MAPTVHGRVCAGVEQIPTRGEDWQLEETYSLGFILLLGCMLILCNY